MRLKKYLKEIYAAYISKNAWGRTVPEHKSAVWKNPTRQEMKNFSKQTQEFLFRWAACHLNKTVVVWHPDAEIHEYMMDFLKKKGVFPSRSIVHSRADYAYRSDYIAGFCYIDDDGSMRISDPQEGFEWSDYNNTVDWSFLKKYFTNSNWKAIIGEE